MVRNSIIVVLFGIILLSCGQGPEPPGMKSDTTPIGQRIFYEIFVHAFYDSNGDGIGDLNGVRDKLDYLQELGVNGLWLLPVHPSPSYHKYDVSDYYGIHPDYGTMEDMKALLAEAHKRDILVLIDMVINHSSDEHPFFLEAKKGKENPFRDYYVWSSDTILHNENPWHWHENHGVTKKNTGDREKYYGFFWKGMPDLNFDKPEVREEMKKIGTYWLTEVGVDGFRLDAIKYIYPDSLVHKNVEWWQEYRACLEESGEDVFLVAELWDKAEYIAPFLDRGVHSAFNFDLSFAIDTMLAKEEDPGLGKLLSEIQKQYRELSDEYQDAIFIKNHDQDRIASLVNDPRKAKLAASLLLTLPGIPFLYYGEEIAMLGKKPDEHIREPMVWDLPGQDSGQTRWIEPQYSTPAHVVPVSLQEKDPESLLSHYRKLIALRKAHPLLATGTIAGLDNINKDLCAYVVRDAEEEILVIHNLTGNTAVLDARQFKLQDQALFLEGEISIKGKTLHLEPFGSLIQLVGP